MLQNVLLLNLADQQMTKVVPETKIVYKPPPKLEYARLLTPHETTCYWMNYPKTANWYIRNKG